MCARVPFVYKPAVKQLCIYTVCATGAVPLRIPPLSRPPRRNGLPLLLVPSSRSRAPNCRRRLNRSLRRRLNRSFRRRLNRNFRRRSDQRYVPLCRPWGRLTRYVHAISIYLSNYLSIYLSIYPSIYPYPYLSIPFPICLSIRSNDISILDG